MANGNVNPGSISKLSILWYALAFLIPLLIFVVWGNNLNERAPILPFVVNIPLWAGAGYLSAIKRTFDKKAWVIWSAAIGAIYAAILVFEHNDPSRDIPDHLHTLSCR